MTTRELPSPLDVSAGSSPWIATTVLWVGRWLVILPINWAAAKLMPPPAASGANGLLASGDPTNLLLIMVLAGPAVETLIECVLPHWVLAKFRRPVPAALFVAVSGALMAVLHLGSVLAVINALITGAFIAYVYWNAMRRGAGAAFLHAVVFHGAINLVGWVMLLLASRHEA